MNVYEIHARGVGQVQDYLGDSCPVFIWPATSQNKIRILPGSIVKGKGLGDGGFRLRADLKFVARVADLPNPGPQLKQKVLYLGAEYQIDSMETFQGDTLVRFECVDPNQGA